MSTNKSTTIRRWWRRVEAEWTNSDRYTLNDDRYVPDDDLAGRCHVTGSLVDSRAALTAVDPLLAGHRRHRETARAYWKSLASRTLALRRASESTDNRFLFAFSPAFNCHRLLVLSCLRRMPGEFRRRANSAERSVTFRSRSMLQHWRCIPYAFTVLWTWFGRLWPLFTASCQ